MPILGYGVFQVSPEECERCVMDAISVGYRLIDTAQAYYNEEGVGKAVAKCEVPRDELFLTTKVWISNAGEEKAAASIDESLRKLRTDYIDLLLIHQPFSDYTGTWRAMEKAVREGKVRAIGLSNFYPDRFVDMAEYAEIKPAVNQLKTNVFSQQWDGSVVAEQRTSYDNMEVVQVEPCDYYTLTDNTWSWATYTDEYGYTWVSWVWPIRHDDGYLHAYYNFINGTPMVTWGNQVVKSFLVDDMSRRTPAMAQTDDSIIIGLDDFTVMFRGHRINANKVPADTSVTVSRDEMHACPQFNSETTADELYEYTVNEIIPNL